MPVCGTGGRWVRLVPPFGPKVKCRRFGLGLGLVDGPAQMVSRRAHKFDSANGDLPAGVLDCPACGVLETGGHILLQTGMWECKIEIAKVQDSQGPTSRHAAFKCAFGNSLRTMDEHAGGSMADGELADMPWYVEETYVELSPVDQQKALQYEEALRNKVKWQ